eukprot:TRINITY_DN1110_c0_g1_i1.p1 TRINITY_DN1110_c0_g1~~TRINITY_DN1110_c0_g1_i1.p1  ORF type:complete len:333 (+),score=104.07 TRINITY_DN1110_c0_g1_i1:84-1082(+)
MRAVVIVALLVLAAALLAAASSLPDRRAQFAVWTAKHHQRYASAAEYERHYAAFAESAARVDAHNADPRATYRAGLNAYSDLTRTEVRERFGLAHGSRVPLPRCKMDVEAGTVVTPVDWRTGGYVSEVKDQGNVCGSCWTFSSTGAIESARAIAEKSKPISLSEQQLLDCSRNGYNNGCSGGAYDLAFQYVIEAGGLEHEEAYPYTAVQGECAANASSFVTTITSFVQTRSGSEKQLQEAIATKGPVSVAIDVLDSFVDYHSGVYYEPNCTMTNLIHEVLAVGMGHDNISGMDYYIVKNSWGTDWGMDGYIWMAANRVNNCGIASYPVYPEY